MTFAIVMASLLAYLYIGGLCGKTYLINKDRNCKCARGSRCNNSHPGNALWLVALWPLGLPLIAGSATAGYIGSTAERKQRKEQKVQIEHQRKLELIQAETEKAKAEGQDSQSIIAYLERNGIRAAVPGLHDYETA